MTARVIAAFAAALAACSSGPPGTAAGPPAAGSDGVVVAVDSALRGRAETLIARALADDAAIAILGELLAAAPKRLSGSEGAAAAVRWGQQKMCELGLTNVRAEDVMVPHWVRGVERAMVLSPQISPKGSELSTPGPEQDLRVTALGGSVGTPPDGIAGEIVMVRSFEQLQELGAAARGRIVFFNRPMPRALRRTGQAYGEAVPQRTNGAVEAAKVGAVAALVRSMTTAIDGFPHTGAMNYQDGVPQVPAAAIATQDADALAALVAQGRVTVRLVLGCETRPDVRSANVIGEIAGSELPAEIVLIGAHLDAWDLGHGAHDDGAGCAHVLEAMRLVQVCGLKPRRTIRAILFMNEENGLRGAKAYAEAHAAEHHAAAIETDSGGFTPQGFTCSLRDAEAEAVRRLFLPLGEFGAGAFVTGGGGGADIGTLERQGVPLFGLMVDGQRYFDYHHTAQDTLDKVNERELALGAAVVAYAASVLADR